MITTKLIRKFFLPGQYYVTDKQMILETIVGSCVSVCLYNRKNGFSAINHFILDKPIDPRTTDVGKYGSTAMCVIIKKLFDVDSIAGNYRARVFGGAAIFHGNNGAAKVGPNNVAVALEILKEYGIPIIKQETGGIRGRRIRFNTAENKVWWRFTGDIPRKNKSTERT